MGLLRSLAVEPYHPRLHVRPSSANPLHVLAPIIQVLQFGFLCWLVCTAYTLALGVAWLLLMTSSPLSITRQTLVLRNYTDFTSAYDFFCISGSSLPSSGHLGLTNPECPRFLPTPWRPAYLDILSTKLHEPVTFWPQQAPRLNDSDNSSDTCSPSKPNNDFPRFHPTPWPLAYLKFLSTTLHEAVILWPQQPPRTNNQDNYSDNCSPCKPNFLSTPARRSTSAWSSPHQRSASHLLPLLPHAPAPSLAATATALGGLYCFHIAALSVIISCALLLSILHAILTSNLSTAIALLRHATQDCVPRIVFKFKPSKPCGPLWRSRFPSPLGHVHLGALVAFPISPSFPDLFDCRTWAPAHDSFSKQPP